MRAKAVQLSESGTAVDAQGNGRRGDERVGVGVNSNSHRRCKTIIGRRNCGNEQTLNIEDLE